MHGFNAHDAGPCIAGQLILLPTMGASEMYKLCNDKRFNPLFFIAITCNIDIPGLSCIHIFACHLLSRLIIYSMGLIHSFNRDLIKGCLY